MSNDTGMSKLEIKMMFEKWIENDQERLVPNTISYNKMALMGIDDMDYVCEFDLDYELAYTVEINDAIEAKLKELKYV